MDNLIDSRPADMPLEMVTMLDQYTTLQVGAFVLWWIKTHGDRFHETTDDIAKHKARQLEIAADLKAAQDERVRHIIDRMRREADDMEDALDGETPSDISLNSSAEKTLDSSIRELLERD